MNVIERMIRASCNYGRLGTECGWPSCGCLVAGDRMRAAIAAMREPTKAMLHAAAKAMSPDRRPTQKRVSVAAKHAIRYRAMIDCALAEGAPKDTPG